MTETRQAAVSLGGGGPAAVLWGQQPRFFLWVPVWIGCGIAGYFGLRWEPDAGAAAGVGMVLILAGLAAWRAPGLGAVLAWIPLLCALGFVAAMLRAHLVAAPVLDWHRYGPVEGRVVALDRSASDVPRVTLAAPWIAGLPAGRTPARVRIALHGDVAGTPMVPGARILLTAHLSPPGGPVEPGGFDFQRKAWFDRLGAVGYTRAPPVLLAPPARDTPAEWIFALRMRVADGLRAAIGGQRGAFAAAILTGDRSAIDPARLEDLRRSNLAHLLAISGLHMGLLSGFVFAVVRLGLAAVPPLALRLPAKKIAACVALVAAAGYLLLSGANVATQRAFVMVAVMLVAVVFDRAAITLRAVALAAVLILLLRPESLASPGFQMSFAATTALVACFEGLNRTRLWREVQRGWLRLVAGPLSLTFASFVAAAATAPVSAFHFNTVAQYGLIANLACVPVMSLLIMPAGVLAAVLWLVGLSGLSLWVMGLGIGWILDVAQWVAGLEGAVRRIPAGPDLALGLVMGGLLFVVLWRGALRWGGTGLTLAGAVFWAATDRPAVLVSDRGTLIGIATQQGRALNRDRGQGFAAEVWLENDGDGATQRQAALRAALPRSGWSHVLANGARLTYDPAAEISPVRLAELCRAGDLLILPKARVGPLACPVLDRAGLDRGGAAAIRLLQDGGLRLVQARDLAGTRLWNGAWAGRAAGP